MHEGYIMLYRKLKKSPFYTDSQYLHLWIHLLLSANHLPAKVKLKGSDKIVDLAEGQFLTSRDTLSQQTGINSSKIERILKCFEIEQQIEQQTFTKYRIISVLKWNEYQKVNSKMNSKRTASEQQVNTNNNNKNNKKESICGKTDFESFWNACPQRAKRCGKSAAEKSWKNNVKGNAQEVILSMEHHAKSKDWQKDNGQFVPMATTWLNQHRWTAEIEEDVPAWKII